MAIKSQYWQTEVNNNQLPHIQNRETEQLLIFYSPVTLRMVKNCVR